MAFSSSAPRWKITNDPTIKISSFCRPSSCFFSTSSSRKTHYKKTHLTKFSLDDSSSTRSRDLVQSGSEAPTSRRANFGQNHSSLLVGEEDDGGVSTGESKTVEIGKVSSQLRRRISKFFAKRPLWKRIFFASKKVRSIILLNILAVIYASNVPVIKEVEEFADPALFTLVRFVVSAIPFLPFIVRSNFETRAAGIELGFWVSLGYLTQALGLLTTDAGRASFITAFTVIAVPLLDGIFGAKVPILTWFGAFASVIGIALLESSGSPPNVGDFLNLLSAVFFGVHMLRTEHYSRITKRENFLALLGYEVLVIALLSAIWYFVSCGVFDVHELGSTSKMWNMVLDWDGIVSFPWIPAFYTGIFSTGLCLWAELAAMRDVSATETAIIYGLEPVWGAAFAWFLLHERWGITGWLGAALIVAGSLTVQIFGSSPEIRTKDEEKNIQLNNMQISDKGKDLPSTKIIVSSRKKATKTLKQK